MNMNDLRILMNGAFGRKVPAEFAAENYDYEKALHDELAKLLCDKNGKFNIYQYQRNKYDVFELLSENLAEVLPNDVRGALDMFTEIMRVPQGSRLEFRVKRGQRRARQFVTRATESGNYQTFRLDHDKFDVYIQAIGGAGRLDFERYLDGLESITDIYEIINAGMVDRIYEMVQEALLATWNQSGRPARNKVAINGFDAAAMTKLCNAVAPYGSPVIYCSPEFASEMVNAITYNNTTKISDQDMMDVRDRGYIGKFHGYPVVVMPQSFTDDTNAKTTMNPSFAYVIPAGKEKIIKLVFEGDPYFKEWENRGDNGIELQAYAKVGLAIVSSPNYWGIYYNSAIDSNDEYGWNDYNKEIVGE